MGEPAGPAAGPVDDVPVAGGLWRFGDVEFDERALELRLRGVPVPLERKPMELLLHLLRHAGEVATKEELLEAVWPGRIVTEASLSKAIARLREVLGDSGQALIRTVHGYGYRLVAEVRLEHPAAPLPPSDPEIRAGDSPPSRPHWKLVQPLGRGGYGEAWLAEHFKTRQRRVFKFGRGEASLAALKREITLYRLLTDSLGERREWVRLLDWNFEDLPFFIEAEYAEDGNLAQWADRQGGIGTLPLPERLRLMTQIAEALAAAHSVGVLHKDLKPANLLVARDEAGQPYLKLCDFGSGRLLEPARLEQLGITQLGFTQTRGVDETTSGTFAYMAPEVAAGQPPTVRADIYSLGVIFYQMVVGDLRKPLAAGWERDIPDELLREDITAAASGDPARRLADASQLAQRLRTLDARRATRAAEQAREREMARFRLRRGWLTAVAVTFLLGFAVSTALYLEARGQRHAAEAQAALAKAVSGFVTEDLLSSANPMIGKSPDAKVRDVLDAAGAALPSRFAGQPELLARLQAVLGSSYGGLLLHDKAEPLLLAAEKSLAASKGDADPETQAVRMSLRSMYLDTLDLKGLGQVSQRMEDAESRAGNPNPAVGFDARSGILIASCLGKGNGSLWLSNCGTPMHALLDEARARLGADDPATLRLTWYTAVSMTLTGHTKEAEPQHRLAYDGLCRLYGADHPRCLEAGMYLGKALALNGNYTEAVPLLQDVTQRMARALAPDHPFTLNALGVLAQAYVGMGQYDMALSIRRNIYETRLHNLGAEAPNTLESLYFLAAVLDQAGHADEARADYQGTLAGEEKTFGPGNGTTMITRNALGRMDLRQGRLDQAEDLLRRNLELARGSMKNGEWFVGQCESGLGEVLLARGKKAEAEPLLQDAVATLSKALGDDDERTRNARAVLEKVKENAASPDRARAPAKAM